MHFVLKVTTAAYLQSVTILIKHQQFFFFFHKISALHKTTKAVIREYLLFSQDLDTLFYLLSIFYDSKLAGWLITHFSVMGLTQNTFNTALHRL